MTYQIKCYSRKEVERGVVFQGSYALISIRDPDKAPVRYQTPTALVGALALAFHDAEPSGGMIMPAHIRLITEEQANQIALFVRENQDRVDGFVIHCEQGMSRSPAVAVAIARYLKQPDTRFWQEHQPNAYVLEVVEEAFETLSYTLGGRD